ncbi:MAG: hypothetical protein Fur0010_23590 [Bdellovibrio sp.]
MQLISILLLSVVWGAPSSIEKFCQGKLKTHDFSKQSIYDCKFAGALAASDEVQHYAREKIAMNLIDKTSLFLLEQLQNFAIADQFFFANGVNLPPSCQLDTIAPIEFKCKVNEDRLLSLKKSLGIEHGSLKGGLANIYKKNLGSVNEKSCPLVGKGMGFHLNAQLDDESFVLHDILKKKNPDTAFIYKAFPQISYLNQAERKLFEDFSKNLSATLSDKDLVLSFFQKYPNINVSKSFGNFCEKMKNSIENVVCDKFEPKILDANVNMDLFKFDSSTPNIDDQLEEGDDVYLGFALYCNHLNSCKREGRCDIKQTDFDRKFSELKEFLRNDSTAQSQQAAMSFCDLYSCNSQKVKEAKSCKAGGPLSLSEFKMIFSCPNSDKCSPDYRKMYSFFKNFEREQARVAEWKKNNSSGTTTVASGTTGPRTNLYSDFTENFLGVEETIKAEGRPVNAQTIAAKTQEFEVRGLSTQEGASVQTTADGGSRPLASVSRIARTSNDSSVSQINDDAHQAQTFAYAPIPATRTSIEVPTVKPIVEVDPESRRMRQELERMIDSLKGSTRDKLTAVADYNTGNIPPSAGGIKGLAGLTASERARVDDLRRQIDDLSSSQRFSSSPLNQDAAYEEQKLIADEALRNRPKEDDFGYDPKAQGRIGNDDLDTLGGRGAG